MKMLRRVAVILGIMVILLFVASLFFDKHLHSEYSVTIPAKQKVIFELLNDLKTWPDWTAWGLKDSTVTLFWSKKTTGEGARVDWINKNGKGSATITNSMPDTLIRSQLKVEGWNAIISVMQLHETDSGTVVKWSLATDTWHPVRRIMGYFIKGWMLRDIKRGLRGLNAWMLENDQAQGKILSMKVYEAPSDPPHSICIIDTLDVWPSDTVRQRRFKTIDKEIEAYGLARLYDPYIRVLDTLPESGKLAMEFGMTVNGIERYKGPLKTYRHFKGGIIADFVGPPSQWPSVADSMRAYAGQLGKKTEPFPYITFSSGVIDKGLYKGCRPNSFALMFSD